MTYLSTKINSDVNKLNQEIIRLITVYMASTNQNVIRGFYVPVIINNRSLTNLNAIQKSGDILLGNFIDHGTGYDKPLSEVTSPLHQIIDYIENEEGYHFEDEIMVCKECGSMAVSSQDWIDTNNRVNFGSQPDDTDDTWCENCCGHLGFVSMAEFKEQMVEYMEGSILDKDSQRETVALIPNSTTETFMDMFNSYDYEKQRELYLKINPDFPEEEEY